MKPKKLDVVQLLDGREATILEVFDDGAAFYVEFYDKTGKSFELDVLSKDKIEKITYVA